MKNLILYSFILFLFIGCSKPKPQSLNKKIKEFQVSECQTNCGLDSIGVKTAKVDNNLNVRIGYILNCSWSRAFFKNISEVNDTLIVELDLPNINGEYPITECDCFFYFNFKIVNYNKTPKAIRIIDIFENGKFLDELKIPEIEETPIIDTLE
ncbi:hypothetical protein [Winogradskyella marincola]|uniref:Lipoprotein n=1 Tax=Winogradskyella marincola TaxID=3037795 RepID=A0ABT6FZ73_9FLAO|nr:hypothetical protein [Winogradskyella sp. YYF002]MDG4715089.1 hypothetical protein [Winogradskyella sp. YYF002]